jgi:catechol 2,3-dioxygenase-like lactoylglutathione lyase family enzyme
MEANLFTGYSHIGIYVTDREKAIEFYEKVLDFELLFRVDNESDGLLIAMLKLGNCFIEVLETPAEIGVLPSQCARDNIVPSAGSTSNHVGITVTDIEKAMERVRSFGYEFESRGPYDVPCFGSESLDLKVVFFRGPNGERIELFQEINK